MLFPEINNKMKTISEKDSIIRQIAQVEDIPMDKVQSVMKQVRILDAKRKKKCLMLGSPPLIVNAILIYVAAIKIHEIKINKTRYVEIGWVSRATLDKYVKVVMKIL
jgi:hypothetical protein